MSNINKEMVISNIIGLNPTGTLDFNGTYMMNGNNNIVKNSANASKANLLKAQNNKIICNHVENFENNNIESKNYYFEYIFLIILIFILIFILFYF